MKLLTVDSIDSARGKLLDCVKGWKPVTEHVAILNACGRILAEDIYSKCDIPAFRRSTVDGYAVVSNDTAGASDALPVFLALQGAVEMGKPAETAIHSGQCAYVPTGGMIPDGADSMVMVEYSEPFGENGVALYEAVPFGKNVVQAGEDVRESALLLSRGTVIRPQEVGALAAAGILEIPVYAPLRLTIISTGDELVSPDRSPAPGEIRDINTYALHALATGNGYRVTGVHVLPDDGALLEQAVRTAMADSDVVVISGGSSQGRKDLTGEVVERVSTPGVLTHGVAIKPGKPTILGYDAKSATVLAGLPGHPVSAMMVFETLLSWLSDTLTGRKSPYPVPAKIACNLASSPGKTTCLPVSLQWNGDGYTAHPVFGKSGLITTLTKADGYVIIEMNKEGLKKDEAVLVHLV